MKILLVLAHPDPGSFNAAIARSVQEALEDSGHRVVFHNLYQEGFDPLLPAQEIPQHGPMAEEIRRHCEDLRSAEGIIIVHPNWWGQPPAVLKGWLDRVFRPGVAYEFLEGDAGEGVPRGLLRARTALVFNTSNTAPRREARVFGDPLQTLWQNCVFGLCGVRDFQRVTFSIVITSSPAQREAWLQEATALARRCFPPGEA